MNILLSRPVHQLRIYRSAAVDGKFWDLFTTWDVTDIPDLSGKVAIVTGPTATETDSDVTS